MDSNGFRDAAGITEDFSCKWSNDVRLYQTGPCVHLLTCLESPVELNARYMLLTFDTMGS
jgi:hypothetical protein